MSVCGFGLMPSRTNRLSTLHPAYKLGISALALGVCLAFDRPLTSALVLGGCGCSWSVGQAFLGALWQGC